MSPTFNIAGANVELLLVAIFLGAMLSMILVGFAILSATSGPQRRLRQRVNQIQGGKAASPNDEKPLTDIKLHTEYSSLQSFDALLRQVLPRPALLRQRIAKTGMEFSLGTYVLINLIVAAVAGILVFKLFNFSLLVPALAALAAGVGLPHATLSYLIARRLNKFIATFPEAIDLIVRGLKSGLPVTESIRSVGEEMIAPVGPEFATIADSIKFGSTLDEALWATAKRLDTPEFKFFVISLSIQQETGGNLAETLQSLSDILRKRRQMRLKVKAMSSEARASAMIIGALPFIMFAIIHFTNPGYLNTLFTDPRGIIMVSAVLGLMLAGVGVMYKMVKFEI